jgi:hypothetical protein
VNTRRYASTIHCSSLIEDQVERFTELMLHGIVGPSL